MPSRGPGRGLVTGCSQTHASWATGACWCGMRRIRAAIAAVVVLSVAPASAFALPRGDADQSDVFFPSTDGTKLHALVLRPAGISDRVKTPVIVSVSPYFSTGVEQTHEQSHERFADFLDLTSALERGYTYVMVDLPGFG